MMQQTFQLQVRYLSIQIDHYEPSAAWHVMLHEQLWLLLLWLMMARWICKTSMKG